MIPYPEWVPRRFNASSDPCDMWIGPCSCGATHYGQDHVALLRAAIADGVFEPSDELLSKLEES